MTPAGLEDGWWFQVEQGGSVILLLLALGFVLFVGVVGIRRRTTTLAATTMFLLGVPVALLSYEIQAIVVTVYDTLAAQIFLVTGGLLLTIHVARVGANRATAELRHGLGAVNPFPRLWIWLVRVPMIAVLLVTLYLALGDYWSFLTGDFVDFLGL